MASYLSKLKYEIAERHYIAALDRERIADEECTQINRKVSQANDILKTKIQPAINAENNLITAENNLISYKDSLNAALTRAAKEPSFFKRQYQKIFPPQHINELRTLVKEQEAWVSKLCAVSKKCSAEKNVAEHTRDKLSKKLISAKNNILIKTKAATNAEIARDNAAFPVLELKERKKAPLTAVDSTKTGVDQAKNKSRTP